MSKKSQTPSQITELRLQGLCKELRLPSVAENYLTMARQAEKKAELYPDYLRNLLEQELSLRDVNRRRRLLKQAKFPITYTMDTYDFSAVPSLSKQKIVQLAQGDFIREHENIVLVGEIGTGKTHIASALGYAACEAGYKVRFFTAAALINQLIEAQESQTLSRLENSLLKQQLIIIDELGFVPFSQQGAQMLFTFLSQRYQRGSVIITTNLPFTEWTQVFHDERLLGALLDRLTHSCHILEFAAESYRFKHRLSLPAETTIPDDPTAV